MADNKIDVGDRVDVYFAHINGESDVRVLHIPSATGDCFILERTDGTIVNVQMYSKMVKK